MYTKRIIIVVSSTFLGLTILLVPFFRKDNSPKKTTNRHLVNNSKNDQQLVKQKSSVLWIGKIIIGIVIIVIILLIIFKFISFLLRKKHHQNKLSGNCRVSLPQKGEIKIYYCLFEPNINFNETIYKFDILEDLPPNIQTIYNNLKTNQKNFFTDFGTLINSFFKAIDGHLLQTVSNDKTQKHKLIDKMWEAININIDAIPEDDVLPIYNQKIDLSQQEKIDIEENADPIAFFEEVMKSHKARFVQNNDQQFPLFQHYFALHDLMERISTELAIFFADKKIKKSEQCQKSYEKAKDIATQIIFFLNKKN